MKVFKEISMNQFNPWGPALNNFASLTEVELIQFEEIVDELYPNGILECKLNDWLAYDFDDLCRLLGKEVKEDA